MANQSQNVDPRLYYLLLPGEAPLPLKDLSDNDITLLANFIATHRDQITLPTFEWDELDSGNFFDLASILRLLNDTPFMNIVDYHSCSVIERIERLQCYKFGGSWLESLKSLIADNEKNNVVNLEILRVKKHKLKYDCDVMRLRVNRIRGNVKKPREEEQWEAEWLLTNKFDSVVQKMKAVSGARKSLKKFFYPT
jgi:hypothetical protein